MVKPKECAKSFFVVSTVNGKDLDYWQFDDVRDARTFMKRRMPRRFELVEFEKESIWVAKVF